MVVGVFFGLLCLLSAVLARIDIRHGIIPDWLNRTIAALGLSKAVFAGGPLAGLEAACEGAAIGAIFWLLRRLYFALRKIQGLGLGWATSNCWRPPEFGSASQAFPCF
jgi:leader peptidase (prepilin peptidase) / N-methyltransferase